MMDVPSKHLKTIEERCMVPSNIDIPISLLKYRQLFLRWTPLGLALSVRLREMSVLESLI